MKTSVLVLATAVVTSSLTILGSRLLPEASKSPKQVETSTAGVPPDTAKIETRMKLLENALTQLSARSPVQVASRDGEASTERENQPAMMQGTRPRIPAFMKNHPKGTPVPPAAQRFSSERADPRWAATSETAVRGFLNSVHVPAERIHQVECRSSVCQIELHDASMNPTGHLRDLERHGLVLSEHESVVPPAGSDKPMVERVFFERAAEEEG